MANNKPSSDMFNIVTSPSHYHQLTREFTLENKDAQRQLQNCERAVKTIASIRHSFLNTDQSALVNIFDDFVTRMLEFHHWRINYHLAKSQQDLESLTAQGYEYKKKGTLGKVKVQVRNSILAKLIDMVQDVDRLLSNSAKVDMSSLYAPSEQQANRARVVGVLRDVHQSMMRLRTVLFEHYKLTSNQSDSAKLKKTCDFAEIKIFISLYCKEQRSYFELVQKLAEEGEDKELQRASLSKHISFDPLISEASRACKSKESGTPREASTLLLTSQALVAVVRKTRDASESKDYISEVFG